MDFIEDTDLILASILSYFQIRYITSIECIQNNRPVTKRWKIILFDIDQSMMCLHDIDFSIAKTKRFV